MIKYPRPQYETARANAGNLLFSTLVDWKVQIPPGPPEFYEEAAQMVKLLVASGLQPRADMHRVITSAARGLFIAMRMEASASDCAEFILFHLQGQPRAEFEKRDAKLRAILGTFYGNLRVTQALARRK